MTEQTGCCTANLQNQTAAPVALPEAPLLQVRDLSILLPTGGDRVAAVDHVSFDVANNQIVCLVGESGSGKSMTAHAIMGLLPPRVRLGNASGINLLGTDLTKLSASQMRKQRGGSLSMVFQEPMSALNPLQRIGTQIAETLKLHPSHGLSRRSIDSQVVEMIDAVGLPDSKTIARSFPNQLSGGQRQRAMIAMALLNRPRLLLADEPTTALDVTTQRQILDLLQRLQSQRHMGVLFITHDFGVVADIADRVIVMHHGRVVEQGTRDEILRNPQDAYTRGLIDAVPGRRHRRASAIPNGSGTSPDHPGIEQDFSRPTRLFEVARPVIAAKEVELTIREGETVSVVGESGSGKSTLGRMVMRLLKPDSGDILFLGRSILLMKGASLRDFRRQVQIVFQDPFASLNPRQKIGDAIARGPILFGTPAREAHRLTASLLERVGLNSNAFDRFPHEFSGGQRQRIAIARALALKPRLLVADEAVSALDVSVQAKILELLSELKSELDLTMLFITHDLRIAAEISNRIIVMQRGCIVESGSPTGTVQPATARLHKAAHRCDARIGIFRASC